MLQLGLIGQFAGRAVNAMTVWHTQPILRLEFTSEVLDLGLVSPESRLNPVVALGW